MTDNKRRMGGFTADGYVRVQRTVLRRVVTDRLQALLRGDFYVRNSLGGEEYEPIVKEVDALSNTVVNSAASSSLPQAPAAAVTSGAAAGMGDTYNGQQQSQQNGNHETGIRMNLMNGSADHETIPPLTTKQLSFSTNLETFFQLIAASIMIDASMRGENSGESDTRFIKKKKKLLVKTLMGPKLVDLCKEVLRFDTVRQGGTVSDTELVESEESQSESSSCESSSDGEVEVKKEKMETKKDKGLHSSFTINSSQPMMEKSRFQPQVKTDTMTATAEDAVETSMMLSLDGISALAFSSKKQQCKLEKKVKKKERKRILKEKRLRRKERKRREKEERRKKRKAYKDKKRIEAAVGRIIERCKKEEETKASLI